ncbi:MAG: enoyl-CoA hydratase/isomerase family protein, partial [Pseudomonadota bacterium]|nr:enoyl-CoA hydratase/isomerase family protein [Pseudomonadota bacterium]
MEPITISIENNVATITNNDAPYNRMTLEYMDTLEEALPELGADDNVRALIFTAAGEENFSVGMN